MSCKSCNKFGANCPYHKQQKFGMHCYKKSQFGVFPYVPTSRPFVPRLRPDEFTHQRTRGEVTLNNFGVKNIKGYSSLTKAEILDFMSMHNLAVPMEGAKFTKDVLFNNLRGTYPGITPADIKLSLAKKDKYENIKARRLQEAQASKLAVEAKKQADAAAKRAEIVKRTYSIRDIPQPLEVVSRGLGGRLPAGSKIKRLTRPEVTSADIDDLADMFSAARARPDEMSDLLTKLAVNFGKNKFGA